MKVILLYDQGVYLRDRKIEKEIISFDFDGKNCVVILKEYFNEQLALCGAVIIKASRKGCSLEGIQQVVVDNHIVRYFCMWEIIY